MKKVLGLDLGTTSIGWALVSQAENEGEKSRIIRAGVRVNPLTTDEKDGFNAGKDITTNADRRIKRGARRNLQRYKLRRENLLSLMRSLGWIDDDTVLSAPGRLCHRSAGSSGRNGHGFPGPDNRHSWI